ncbi:hypothetical protein LCGC14_2717400 [marine sediment metagenome]|uniref:Uncharacterized protein n=1 Tax=marine sediment metagenome TaxID=412755 RepID=A0A0F8ZB90_9ZZZZ
MWGHWPRALVMAAVIFGRLVSSHSSSSAKGMSQLSSQAITSSSAASKSGAAAIRRALASVPQYAANTVLGWPPGISTTVDSLGWTVQGPGVNSVITSSKDRASPETGRGFGSCGVTGVMKVFKVFWAQNAGESPVNQLCLKFIALVTGVLIQYAVDVANRALDIAMSDL